MKIAICDDNAKELSALAQVLTAYQQAGNNISFDAYTNATDLIFHMKSQNYDLLLLDILMPGLNGLAAGEEIRRFNEKVEIIFLTSSAEYALDSYRVRAYYYLLKPVSEAALFPHLDRLLDRLQSQNDLLHLKTSQRIISLPFHRIEAVEVINKTLYFHLTDGSNLELRLPLSECEQQLLSRPEFVKPHRSYLVNLQHMRELGNQEFISLSGLHIPVARGHYKQIKERYVKHLFDATEEESTWP